MTDTHMIRELAVSNTLGGVPLSDYIAFRERSDIGAVPGLFVFQHLCEKRMIEIYGGRLSKAVTVVYQGQYKAAYASTKEVDSLKASILRRLIGDGTFEIGRA